MEKEKFFMNKFDILSLPKNKEITEEMVKWHYERSINIIQEKLEKILEDTELSKEERLERQKDLKEFNDAISNAYKYCKKAGAIALRNRILLINEDLEKKSLSNVPEFRFNKGNTGVNIRTSNANEPSVVIDRNITIKKILDMVYENKIDSQDIEKLYTDKSGIIDYSLGKYQLNIKTGERETTSYEFYAGSLDNNELATNLEYQQFVLQAIEKNLMENDSKYIGEIHVKENGKMNLVKDDGQKAASIRAEKDLKEKEKRESDEWEK